MVLSLKYGDLTNTIREANRLADELVQYCNELSDKVQKKMYSVEGGMSSALNSADYYVNQKIRQLRVREGNARNIAFRTQNLLETATRVDTDVEKTIQANQDIFFEKNPVLRASVFSQAVASLKSSTSAISVLLKDIRYWYKCEGGKEKIGIALSVANAILATVVLVCACVFTGGGIIATIVAIASFISSMIAYFNAAANIATSIVAYNQAVGGHPGKAKIYAGMDKISDVLRQTNFHNKKWNRGSNKWATGIELTDAICSVVTAVNGIVKTGKDIFKKRESLIKSFKAICQPRNSLGQFMQGKGSLWNGIKSIALKFDMKNLLLGDLNVKNLSRISSPSLSKATKYKAVSDLAKAMKGIMSDFDAINEGKQSLGNFLLKRITVGLDTALLKQQKLETAKDSNGKVERKYINTNFSDIVKAVRVIDDLGISKLVTNQEHSGNLSYILNTKDGGWQKFTNLIKKLQVWNALKVEYDGMDSGKVVNKDVSSPIEIHCDFSKPTFIMPTFKFDFKLGSRYPYYNVKSA